MSYIYRITPILPNFASHTWGARFRCEIGRWNFDGSHFIATAQGDGTSESDAIKYAQNDLNNPAPHIAEDSMMLGHFNS